MYEETGAIDFTIKPISVYSVKGRNNIIDNNEETFGMLFFAEINDFGTLPDYEIAEVIIQKELPTAWTYPEIQPILLDKIQEVLMNDKPKLD